MWAIDNKTPYAADRTWVRDRNGRHDWIVVIKATYDIGAGGELSIAEEQMPPLFAPEHFGAPESSSIRYEADMVGLKPATDVLVNATAHAPGGKPAPSVPVALQIGQLRKTLVVYGARVHYDGVSGLTTTAPLPFVSQEIRYEAAFGGVDDSDPNPSKHRMDLRNPIGRGFAARSRNLHGNQAPSVVYPSGDPKRHGPAGFGSLAAWWSPRCKLFGSYDELWEKTKKPLLPDDYDSAALLSSPMDQRPGRYLDGEQRIDLVNMTPDGTMSFALPAEQMSFVTFFGRTRREHEGRLVTLLVEPDELRVFVTWQTSLSVSPMEVEHLDRTVVTRIDS